MFRLAASIPRDIVVACSGGADSMALLSFCMNGKKTISVLHVDHKTEHAKEARKLVVDFCKQHTLSLIIREVSDTTSPNEEKWRNQRLQFYKEFTDNGRFVATAHHLDDAVEWYLLSTIHGNPDFMSPINVAHSLIKPFLYVEKVELIGWCKRHNIPFVTDPTNIGNDNARAIMRSTIIPQLLVIHPGLKRSIKNKMLKQFYKDGI